jgi:hypothetical protein
MFIIALNSTDLLNAIIYTIHEMRSVAAHYPIIQLGHNLLEVNDLRQATLMKRYR